METANISASNSLWDFIDNWLDLFWQNPQNDIFSNKQKCQCIFAFGPNFSEETHEKKTNVRIRCLFCIINNCHETIIMLTNVEEKVKLFQKNSRTYLRCITTDKQIRSSEMPSNVTEAGKSTHQTQSVHRNHSCSNDSLAYCTQAKHCSLRRKMLRRRGATGWDVRLHHHWLKQHQFPRQATTLQSKGARDQSNTKKHGVMSSYGGGRERDEGNRLSRMMCYCEKLLHVL